MHAPRALPFFKYPSGSGRDEIASGVNLNFRLNRLVADGDANRVDEVRKAARCIVTFEDWAREMVTLGAAAERSGRIGDAARYVRASEFFVDPEDARKRATRLEFIELANRAWSSRFERLSVRFETAELPVLRFRGAA